MTSDGIQVFPSPSLLWTLVGTMLAATLLLTPAVMALARRKGVVDSGGHRRIHQKPIPLMGGLAIASPFLLLCALGAAAGYFAFHHWQWLFRRDPRLFQFMFSVAEMRDTLLLIALGGAGIVMLGVVDDARGLRARYKLLGQVVVAVLVCALGGSLDQVHVPFVGDVLLGPMLGFLVSVLWIVGLVNAVNLIDGMDGLATGVTLIGAGALAFLGFFSDNTIVAITCAALSGSLLAFLFYNFHPAKIFLGDTGSMFLGFVLGAITLTGSHRSDTALIILGPLLALSFPVFETLISMVRRFVRGMPIFAGDDRHTHHRLIAKGYSQRQAVLILYTVTFLLAGAAVASQFIPPGPWEFAPLAIAVLTFAWIIWLADYFEPALLGRVFRYRGRNRLLDALARYAGLALGAHSDAEARSEVLGICRQEMRLFFLSARFESSGTIIASSGTRGEADASKVLRVKTNLGQTIVVEYQFDSAQPDDFDSRAVPAFLARVFENADIRPDADSRS
jgi:UDP-GlcNAc:undecaprenyl-phosphate/decaprenyl-phosphate GlcNAc-1-phosphate transferase